ncbi:MAG: hypothetical protein Q9185_004634 [Variospora sp. 1 TL-2023]
MVSLRSSKRKQQTRLSFTPLPSSSPTPSDLPESIQTRAANIRYDATASPTKKRRLGTAPTLSSSRHIDLNLTASAAKGSARGTALPTPEPSSQLEAKQENVDAPTSPSSQSSLSLPSVEEEDPVVPGSYARRTAKLPEKPKAGNESDSSDSLMNELGSSARKPRGGPRANYEDSDGSDAVAVTPRRGRRLLRKDHSSPVAHVETTESSSSDGLELPKNTGTQKNPTRANRPNDARGARQKQLELLRRRRAGRANQRPTSGDELEIVGQPDDTSIVLGDLDEDSDLPPPINPVNLDEYEQDFVDDDNDSGTLGAPADFSSIPLEFTRHAHKKPIEHFKDVVEWMVHNKLNPAFARNDPVYTISCRKLDDVVQGFAGSKFISSAWRPEFSAALKKYPEAVRIDVPTMFDQKCEACGRSGHPAKHQLTFQGKPYHRESLEAASSSSSSSSSSDDDDTTTSESETPKSKAFFLGRTCNANAETAHALHHWRHHLNHFVLDLLRADGHTAPPRVVEREAWSVKKRERHANGVVDAWEAEGQLRRLYREFKENLEAARGAQNEAYSYGRLR